MGSFADAVFAVVRRIPRGNVTTYGQIARLIGHPRSARYVGFALRSNPSPGSGAENIPCHRVVFADGRICEGFQFGGPDVQRAMLEDEGVAFVDRMHVDLDACRWRGETPASAGAEEPTAPPAVFDWKAELGECDDEDRA